MEPKNNSKDELISYLNSIVIILIFVVSLGLPIFFATFTTDFFTLPKQALLGAVVLISLITFVLKVIVDRAFRIRRTIFDLPIVLLILSFSLSSLFAVNRFDSFIALLPFLFLSFYFFITVNFVRSLKSLILLILFLGVGTSIASIISVLSYLKIYILPFAVTQTQTFTPLGSILDQAAYIAILIPIAIFFLRKKISHGGPAYNENAQAQKEKATAQITTASTILIILMAGFTITILLLFNPPNGIQKLTILPFQTGFQTGLASISQDTQRTTASFLFGSGYGTYLTNFTRYKQPAINQNPDLWSLSFVRSSSFVIELLGTTGILGILSFIFLTIRAVKNIFRKSIFTTNPISISLILSIIALFILPVGFTVQALFFILLAMFSVFQGFKKEEQKRFFDVELQLVALRRGLFNLETFIPLGSIQEASHQDQKETNKILPVILGAIILCLVFGLGFFSIRYLISDIEFQNSLVLASQNKAQETYQKQSKAISIFPYRDVYHRVFSQTNLALANSLATQQGQAASPSAEIQRTIYTLIQQSINSARAATSISPLTSLNWQNLSSIYRSLIGFGENAESFAVVTQQQAILLDPNNPQGYIMLGGIYYQLGLWENAQSQFQIAVNLKSDFANAHYNLGHALESKGDLQSALSEYETVRTLVANDENSLTLISSEIEAIKNKIEEGLSARLPEQNLPIPQDEEPSLNLSTPSAQLPPQNPPVEIPGPQEIATESAE